MKVRKWKIFVKEVLYSALKVLVYVIRIMTFFKFLPVIYDFECLW